MSEPSQAPEPEELVKALLAFDEFIYFPSIDWNHSWERQQTVISHFCAAHAGKVGHAVAPTGLIDHAPWRWATIRSFGSRLRLRETLANAQQHADNPQPSNLRWIAPRFSRGTNALFAALAHATTPQLRALSAPTPGRRRLVMACYVNPLVEQHLRNASLSIIDLAERRQKNPALSEEARARERYWAARADLLVADNAATLNDYAADRAAAGRPQGYLIPQGFTPPQTRPGDPSTASVAAYLGNLHHAIDYPLFEALIRQNPQWEFRLCGARMDSRADSLIALPNVRYSGVIDRSGISRFLAGAAIGLIPYLRSEWTEGVFPTKLFEYLAHGVPVLSTAIPEVERFRTPGVVEILTAARPLQVHATDARTLAAFIEPHTWTSRMRAYGLALQGAAR